MHKNDKNKFFRKSVVKFFLKLRLVYYFIQALHITLVSAIITEKENFLEYGVEDFQLEI